MFQISSEKNIRELYLPSISARTKIFYWTLLLLVVSVLVSLPLVKVDISVRSSGIVRPLNERTELKSPVSGIIDSIFFAEGSRVQKGDILFRFKNENAPVQNFLQQQEIGQRQLFIHDLNILTTTHQFSESTMNLLKTPLFKQQFNRYLHSLVEKQSLLNKSRRQYEDNVKLYNAKVISEYEMIDKKSDFDQQTASISSFENDQRAQWEQLLVQYKMESAGFSAQQEESRNNNKVFEIRAPENGTLQGISGLYNGNAVMAGDILGVLSPDTTLIAECFLSSRDIGLIKLGQKVKFHVDAFDYKYFGTVSGEIIQIDNDVSVKDTQLLYKVRCRLDRAQLHLKNGYKVSLKKGLTLQARFLVAKRSIWQLIFDKLDNWFTPGSPEQMKEQV